MNEDRTGGVARQAKGSVKEALGKLMGDTKLEREGKAEQVSGSIEKAASGAKDTLRGIADR